VQRPEADLLDQADPRWTTSGWGYGVTSMDQAFRAVSRIVTLAPGRRYVWRGCGNRSHRLRSSLLRDLIIEESEPLPTELQLRRHELGVLREARKWGLGTRESDLALLASLHRHGVPTRLLDVTHDPMTALWFACAGGEEAGVLFAFDVTDCPTYDPVDPTLAGAPGAAADPREWSLRCALAVSAGTGSPFLVRPALPDARLQAQEGLFLSGAVPRAASPAGIDGLPVPFAAPPGREKLASLFAAGERAAGRPTRLPFCAVVIPARLKKRITEHLTAVNRGWSTLFPDVDGFRSALRDGAVALHPLPDALPAHDDADAVTGQPRGAL
jgi:FRG domain